MTATIEDVAAPTSPHRLQFELPPDLERVFLDLTRGPAKEASKETSKEAA